MGGQGDPPQRAFLIKTQGISMLFGWTGGEMIKTQGISMLFGWNGHLSDLFDGFSGMGSISARSEYANMLCF